MLVARVAPPLPDGDLPPQVTFGARPGQQVVEIVAPPGGVLVRRLAADLAGLGYEVAWIRPMPFEADGGSLAPLVLMALTAARRASSGEHEPVVAVVESPTAAQAEAVLDQLLPPGVPEPFEPGVMLVVDRSQPRRPRHTELVRVQVAKVREPGTLTRQAVQRLLHDAPAPQLAALEMASHLGYAHARLDSLECAAPGSPHHPWWVPLADGWWQVDPAWRPSLVSCTGKATGVARSVCLSRLVAELAEAGAIHEGIELCLNAGWPGMAADLLTEEADALVSSGHLVALTCWLERLPREEARSRPSLARVAAELIPADGLPAGEAGHVAVGPGKDRPATSIPVPPSRRRWIFHWSSRRPLAGGALAAPARTDSGAGGWAGPVSGTERIPGAVPGANLAGPVRVEARLLGQFELVINGHTLQRWRGNRGRLLLAFLLLHRGRPLARDELGGAFWPDAAPELVRNRLHVALYGLRKDLRALSAHPIVVHGQRGFSLHPGVDLWVDTEAFGDALAAARACQRGGQPDALRWYELALQLHRGDLLEDAPFEEWALLPRERLRLQHLDVLDQVARLRFEAGRYVECLDVCQQLIPGDLCREEIYRLVMRCYTRLNQPHLAVCQYQQCERQLRDELGVEPAGPTRQLYDAIRRRELV